jgi:hypothetical protein
MLFASSSMYDDPDVPAVRDVEPAAVEPAAVESGAAEPEAVEPPLEVRPSSALAEGDALEELAPAPAVVDDGDAIDALVNMYVPFAAVAPVVPVVPVAPELPPSRCRQPTTEIVPLAAPDRLDVWVSLCANPTAAHPRPIAQAVPIQSAFISLLLVMDESRRARCNADATRIFASLGRSCRFPPCKAGIGPSRFVTGPFPSGRDPAISLSRDQPGQASRLQKDVPGPA